MIRFQYDKMHTHVGQSAEGLLDFGLVCPGGKRQQESALWVPNPAQTSNNILSLYLVQSDSRGCITALDYKRCESPAGRYHPVQILLTYRWVELVGLNCFWYTETIPQILLQAFTKLKTDIELFSFLNVKCTFIALNWMAKV